MMKRSLLTSIVALASMTTLATGAARAAETGETTLAKSLEEGATYKISTVINGTNYYLTSGGTLSTTESDADEFTFGTGTEGLYSSGFFSVINSAGSHATNPEGDASSYEAGSNIRFTENRNRTWDTQVFFYDSSTELYAVRATNVDSESQGWGPNTYWAVNTSDATAYYGTSAEFVWSITEVSAAPDYQVFSFDGSAWESYGSYGQGIGSQSTDQLAFDGSAKTWGRIADDTYYYIPSGKALKITGTGFAAHTSNDPFVQWTIDGSTAKTSNSSIYRSDDGTTLIAPITVPSGATTVSVDGEEQYKCTLIDICFALTSGSAATVSSMEFIASGGTQCVGKEGTVAGESCIFPLSEDTYVSSVWYDTKNRTFEEKSFNTIIWPLDLSAEEIATRFGENAQAYEFTGVDGSTALFSTVSEMKANTPYLLRNLDEEAFSTNYGRKIGAQIIPASTVADCTVSADGWNFVGVYAYNTATVPAGAYVLQENNFAQTDEEAEMYGGRAYLISTSSDARTLDIQFDGKTTDAALSVKAQSEDGPTFNVAGQRVNQSYKGITIRNGQKVVK